jgi:hypothetical protein
VERTDPPVEGVSVLAELRRLGIRYHVFVAEPRPPHRIPRRLRFILIPQNQRTRATPHAIAPDHDIALDPRPIL